MLLPLALLLSTGVGAAWRVPLAHARAAGRHAELRATASTVVPSSADHLRRVYREIFDSFASSREFAEQQWARQPVLCRGVANVAGSFTLDDVRDAVDSDFLEAGIGISDAGSGWKMAAVSEPRGTSYEDAKLRYIDVADGMQRGTVVFNSAGAHIPKLAAVCLAALEAFGLPNCLNLYLSGRGLKTSAPPHTDKQDVFVLQTAGSKHWRVFAPPDPSLRPKADPLARGKGNDVLSLEEMGEPLLETRLDPGDVLYVPAGYPHTTHTEPLPGDEDSPATADSVHMTLGVDTHIWGLSILGALQGALKRAKLDAMPAPTTLPAETYWELMRIPTSMGFLAQHAADEVGPALTGRELARASVMAEPQRWGGASEADVVAQLGADWVHAHLEQHREKLVRIQTELYEEAVADDGSAIVPGMPRVTLLRVKPHMDKIEETMEEHVQWYAGSATPKIAPAGAAASTSGFGGTSKSAVSRKGKAKSGTKRKKR